ncbi:hypothetical protein D7X33_05005 [Butyricicoccus sp. 1XD8-22]|nr:hypothetical protein D7X33_05005 [Butyricicoccus sp. 1XD8-22]
MKAGGKVRFTDIELEYSDILWFAVDRNGCLAGFTSGGTLFVPEFVRKSKEETELLETFFCAQLPAVTQYVLDVPDKENGLISDSKMLSEKGLFCFDLPDAHDAVYKRVCSPLIPLCLDSLPVDFMKIMQCHRLEVDFRTAQTVQVKKGC